MSLKKVIAALVLMALISTTALADGAIITANTRVYQKPSKSSASIKVPKGTEVELLATKGSWAMVERAGIRAYMNARQVERIAAEPDYSELMKTAQPAQVNAAARVYRKASTSSASTKVPKGMQVNLLSTSGSWALVENKGVYGYMKAGYLTPVMQHGALIINPQPAVITKNTRVYKEPSTSSASIRVSQGMKVDLLLVSGSWALVQNGSVRAYIAVDCVSIIEDAVVEKPAEKPAETPSAPSAGTTTGGSNSGAATVVGNYLDSDKYTNEQKVYLFLTREMGLNSAAACGVMANIRHESNFNPTAGSTYYGLIQWGGGRKTNLKNFCADKGYSYSSLEGQLHFLHHELKNSYSSVLKYLQAVPDTSKGAYDAAYHFCYYYERPSNKASKSAKRGELASGTYYPKYYAV